MTPHTASGIVFFKYITNLEFFNGVATNRGNAKARETCTNERGVDEEDGGN